mmetsp:Transcript_135133/g.234307  ORF Transcript_135133/g.234307 Transcript_135133/m.234307 type:complete len:190 (+) Transcript_135133:1255-1824(+)
MISIFQHGWGQASDPSKHWCIKEQELSNLYDRLVQVPLSCMVCQIDLRLTMEGGKELEAVQYYKIAAKLSTPWYLIPESHASFYQHVRKITPLSTDPVVHQMDHQLLLPLVASVNTCTVVPSNPHLHAHSGLGLWLEEKVGQGLQRKDMVWLWVSQLGPALTFCTIHPGTRDVYEVVCSPSHLYWQFLC